jgi:hypothetical protein
MKCSKCGVENSVLNNANICVNCSEALANAEEQSESPIRNYLIQSVLVTICCCMPLGIPAIVFAAQVNSKLDAGNLRGAAEASRQAKLFCWLAFSLGLAGSILYIFSLVVRTSGF